MSAKIRLPHGSVPTGAIKDPAVREATLKLNENIAKLLTALADLRDRLDALEQGG